VANLIPYLKGGSTTVRKSWPRRALEQVIRLVLVGVLLGWLYAWGAPLIYREKSTPGFWLGCAHGALMPMALPSLLMQKDVPIYAAVNAGRIYKIGYIAGINGCGFVVFGLSFWKPQRRSKF
jgi:cyanate permease